MTENKFEKSRKGRGGNKILLANGKIAEVILGQSENSVAILLSGYSFVSLRHETMASITDSIS